MRPIHLLRLLLLAASATAFAAEPVFERQVIDAEVEIGYGLALGDVDGDGKTDVVLADKSEFAWYRNPDWKRFTLASRLTIRDNVCLAVRDLDGDGKVEIAVGGNWNPNETTNEKTSGSVHWLERPEDPTQLWNAVTLPHEPTVHRMRWMANARGRHELVVLPLHGRGNVKGAGENGSRVLAYLPPAPGERNDPAKWKTRVLFEGFHKTHNLDLVEAGRESVVIGGAEGLWSSAGIEIDGKEQFGDDWPGIGEVRFGPRWTTRGRELLHYAAIEPLHGNTLAVYDVTHDDDSIKTWRRTVLDESLNQGHALACGDLLGGAREEIVVGWRKNDATGKTGLKLYAWQEEAETWQIHRIDETIACEDLRLADLDDDGRLDVIAAGRDSHDLVILWNRSVAPPVAPLAGGWTKHVVWSGESCATATAADVTGDGRIDILLSGATSDRLLVAPDWKETTIKKVRPGIPGRSIHAGLLDVDGDGDLDFIGGARLVYWLENPGPEQAAARPWKLRIGDGEISGVHCVLDADVDGDGRPDLLVNEFNPDGPLGNSITWQSMPPPGNADAPWERHVFARGDAPGGNHYMGFGDLDGDGHGDVSCGAKGSPFAGGNWFAWWKNPGPAGVKGPWERIPVSQPGEDQGATCILPADLDGDGDGDLMASRGHGAGVLWFENKDGKGRDWIRHEIDPRLGHPHCLTIGDFDRDGDIDAATTARTDKRTVWYENDGEGGFAIHDIDDNQSAYDIRAIDMDADGDLDLLVAGQASKNVVWYENQLGQ